MRRLRRSFLALACMGAAIPACADSPPLPPIYVVADSLRVQVKENIAVWRGNVEATQGNFRFKASRLTIRLDQIADGGEQAGTGDNTPGARPRFELAARQLSYDLASDSITGAGNSELRRGAELIRADKITYDVAQQVARAYPGADGRVHAQFLSNPDRPVFPHARPAFAGLQAR